MRRINDLLPHDIHILDAVRARDGFHARHDAVSRSYVYQISTRRTAFAKAFVWWIRDQLDVDAMAREAGLVAGRHDFSAFTDRRLKEEDSRIVVVERCELARAEDLILIRIAASHFLWKMVRKLISFLVEVGRGNESLIGRRLHEKGEHWAPTAPPSGLFLEAVLYEGDAPASLLRPVVPVHSSGRGRR
jgi:tRNA pseudouridine38-40 synthase